MSDDPRPDVPADLRAPRRAGGTPNSLPIAAILSVVGLLAIGVVTYALGTGDVPISVGSPNGPASSDNPGALQTQTPPDVVVVPTAPPQAEDKPVPGTIVYVKDGNVWIQSNGQATQLTKGGRDSMPTFSPDGSTVYFVRERDMKGKWGVNGVVQPYNLSVPALTSIPVAGGKATRVLDGIVNGPNGWRWNAFIRNPAVSASGRYIAIATDLPDPTRSDVKIKIYDTKQKRLIDPNLSEVAPLGHQDPVWRPGTDQIVYVRSDRDGAKGTPRLYQYDMSTKKAKAITGPGYLHPSFSPDGKYITATKTSAFGTDVVILNSSNGAEVMRLTNDGDSWAPVWSPAGDQIAYLHVAGTLVDLRLIQLEGSGPNWTAKDPIQMTENAGLDGASHPDWFVPADQLPQPTQAPSTAPSPSAGGSTAP